MPSPAMSDPMTPIDILVVDVEHAAADHHRDIHRQRHRHRQQILQIIHVRIKLDDFEGDGLCQPVLNLRCVHGVDQRLQFAFEGR